MVDGQGWRGVRLHALEAGADPDQPTRTVMLPVGWDETAAAGLVALAPPPPPGQRGVLRLPQAAARWIAPLDRRARAEGRAQDLGARLHAMLLRRQGCPDRAVWCGGEAAPDRPGDGADHPSDEDRGTGYALHLGAFAHPGAGFDEAGFAAAVAAATLALSLAAVPYPSIRIAGLDLMLASLGHEYDGAPARRVAAAVLRGARREIAAVDPDVRLVAGRAGAAEALLGVETAGFAPPFDLIAPCGGLTAGSRARLAQRGLSFERALAMTLAGRSPLRLPPASAHLAMHDAVAPLLDEEPRRPHATGPARLVPVPAEAGAPVPVTAPVPAAAPAAARGPTPAEPARRPMPARRRGFTQRVSIGGQRLYLRTGQYEDGRLGEIALAMPGRGDGSLKGLLDAVSASVGLGLQHGIGLEAFVALFAGSRFGCHGPVEGDPSILAASSPLDYVFRALSEAYLGRHVADPPAGRAHHASKGDQDMPLLPFDAVDEIEPRPRQRTLRLVHAS